MNPSYMMVFFDNVGMMLFILCARCGYIMFCTECQFNYVRYEVLTLRKHSLFLLGEVGQ